MAIRGNDWALPRGTVTLKNTFYVGDSNWDSKAYQAKNLKLGPWKQHQASPSRISKGVQVKWYKTSWKVTPNFFGDWVLSPKQKRHKKSIYGPPSTTGAPFAPAAPWERCGVGRAKKILGVPGLDDDEDDEHHPFWHIMSQVWIESLLIFMYCREMHLKETTSTTFGMHLGITGSCSRMG